MFARCSQLRRDSSFYVRRELKTLALNSLRVCSVYRKRWQPPLIAIAIDDGGRYYAVSEVSVMVNEATTCGARAP